MYLTILYVGILLCIIARSIVFSVYCYRNVNAVAGTGAAFLALLCTATGVVSFIQL